MRHVGMWCVMVCDTWCWYVIRDAGMWCVMFVCDTCCWYVKCDVGFWSVTLVCEAWYWYVKCDVGFWSVMLVCGAWCWYVNRYPGMWCVMRHRVCDSVCVLKHVMQLFQLKSAIQSIPRWWRRVRDLKGSGLYVLWKTQQRPGRVSNPVHPTTDLDGVHERRHIHISYRNDVAAFRRPAVWVVI